MNDDNEKFPDVDIKDFLPDPKPEPVPSRGTIRAVWKDVIRTLKKSKVCFYPGRNSQAAEFADFVGALPLIGNCDALVYAVPWLTKREVRQRVEVHRSNPNSGISFEMLDTGDMPVVDRQELFGQMGTEWVPPAATPATPPDDRFWGLYCCLTIANRTVHVLHIGIAGDAAWAYFLQPNSIQPARIIATRPW